MKHMSQDSQELFLFPAQSLAVTDVCHCHKDFFLDESEEDLKLKAFSCYQFLCI